MLNIINYYYYHYYYFKLFVMFRAKLGSHNKYRCYL